MRQFKLIARSPQCINGHIGRCRPKGWGFAPTGIHFVHFDLESPGYGFQGNYGKVRTYLLFQFQMSKKEREICEFEKDFRKSFLLLF